MSPRSEDGVAEIDSYARLDGNDAISLSIQKQSGANTVAVANAVKDELAVIFASRTDTHYFVPSDQSTFIEESTTGAIEELVIACIAALLVVLLFFRDIRNTLVTVAGLPVIMITTFAALSLFGLSINVVTLMALALGGPGDRRRDRGARERFQGIWSAARRCAWPLAAAPPRSRSRWWP